MPDYHCEAELARRACNISRLETIAELNTATMANIVGTYLVHHNYRRPFKVVVGEKTEKGLHLISVYGAIVNPETEELVDHTSHVESEYHTTPYLEIESSQVFIGESLETNKYAVRNQMHGNDYRGNTILFATAAPGEYIHVGERILKFNSLAPIVTYDSPVCKSDVAWPVATDVNKNYYLIFENVILVDCASPITDHTDDPYELYYRRRTIASAYDNASESSVNKIRFFKIGSEFYTLKWTPEAMAALKFDALIELGNPITIEDFNGVEKILTKEKFVEMMRVYGVEQGFRYLDGKELRPCRT